MHVFVFQGAINAVMIALLAVAVWVQQPTYSLSVMIAALILAVTQAGLWGWFAYLELRAHRAMHDKS